MKTCSVHAPRGACRTAQVIQIPCFARPRPRPTLSEADQAWLAASEGRLKPSTLSIYAGILRAHIDPALGQRPLHALSGREIEAFFMRKSRSTGESARSGAPHRQQYLHRAARHFRPCLPHGKPAGKSRLDLPRRPRGQKHRRA